MTKHAHIAKVVSPSDIQNGLTITEDKAGLELARHLGTHDESSHSQVIPNMDDGETLTSGTATAEYNSAAKEWFVTPDDKGFKPGSNGAILLGVLTVNLQSLMDKGLLPDRVTPEKLDPEITIEKNIFG